MSKTSVREYAILYVGGKRVIGGTGMGGNVLLNAGQHALDGPEHTGQLPASRVSVEDALDFFVGDDVEEVLAELASRVTGGSGGAGGGMLDAETIDLAATVTETSSTPSAVDSALAVTFMAPASGKVVVTLSAMHDGLSGYDYYWVVLEGSTNRGEAGIWADGSGHYTTAVILITGVPEGLHTYHFAHRTAGAGSTSVVDFGKPVITVTALPADIVIIPQPIDQTAQTFAPTVTANANVVALALLDQTAVAMAPTKVELILQEIALALLDRTAVATAPSNVGNQYKAMALARGTLVSYYPFDEASGAFADSGPDNISIPDHANLVHQVAGALTDGSYGLHSNGFALSTRAIGNIPVGTAARSFEWFHKSTNGTLQPIMEYGTQGSTHHWWRIDTGGSAVNVSTWADDQGASPSPGINNGSWRHIVLTFAAGGSQIKLYVDGAFVANLNYGGGLNTDSTNFNVFADSPTHGTLLGDIDELAIYAEALDATYIANHYAAR